MTSPVCYYCKKQILPYEDYTVKQLEGITICYPICKHEPDATRIPKRFIETNRSGTQRCPFCEGRIIACDNCKRGEWNTMSRPVRKIWLDKSNKIRLREAESLISATIKETTNKSETERENIAELLAKTLKLI